jgi:hypothetical protein
MDNIEDFDFDEVCLTTYYIFSVLKKKSLLSGEE